VFGKQIEDQKTAKKANQDKLAAIEQHKLEIPALKAQLPRWQRQFEIFRAAIPVKLEDDVFLRNLDEQLRANNVRLSRVELSPGGPFITNLNENQEQAYLKEHMKPEEIRAVKYANFSVSLSGNYADVLRAFENLKLYGRIFSISQIISPSGGAGGAVFKNLSQATTPIEVSGRVFYGLSEGYLSQDTLDRYFGHADTLGAAGAVSAVAMDRASQIATNPNGTPAPSDVTSSATGAPAGDQAGGTGGTAPPPAAKPAGSASTGVDQRHRVAQTVNTHHRKVAVGG
jgi:hypothetical protein